MAKLSIFYLPTKKVGDVEETPFALVLSDCDPDFSTGLNNAVAAFKDNCGARAMLVTPFPVEVD